MIQNPDYQALYRRVRNAHVRHFCVSLYFYIFRSLFYSLIAACAIAVLLKLSPWHIGTYEYWIPVGIMALSLLLACWIAWIRRGSLRKTAVLADKHLHLKEKISSALELGRLEDTSSEDREWNAAVLQDALKAAERIHLKKAFPLANPTELRWIWLPAMVLLITVFVLPQWEYLRGNPTALAEAAEKQQVKKELQNLLQRQLVIEREAREKDARVASELSKQIKDLAADLSKGKLEKRDAFAKLSSLEQEWEKRKEQIENMQAMMEEPLHSGMKPKMTNELMEALEDNNFEKAAQALAEIQKQLKLGNIDQQGKQQLSEELKQMASLMNMDTPLAKALENAGQVLQGNELNEAMQPLQLAEMSLMDMKDLMDQMALIQSALKDLKDCKFALAGKGLKEGEGFGEGESFGKGGGRGEGDGWGPEGVSPWKPGDSRGRGNGMGGPGMGRGANAPNEKTDTQLTPDKLKGMFGNAPIQAVIPVDGASIKGQSNLGISDSAGIEYSQEAEEALSKERVPLPLRHQVRQYFETRQDTTTESSTNDSENSGDSKTTDSTPPSQSSRK